jgi:hypothetical protein
MCNPREIELQQVSKNHQLTNIMTKSLGRQTIKGNEKCVGDGVT